MRSLTAAVDTICWNMRTAFSYYFAKISSEYSTRATALLFFHHQDFNICQFCISRRFEGVCCFSCFPICKEQIFHAIWSKNRIHNNIWCATKKVLCTAWKCKFCIWCMERFTCKTDRFCQRIFIQRWQGWIFKLY